MIEVLINDLSVFDKDIEKMYKAMGLLSFYTQYLNEENTVKFTKLELTNILNRSRRTITYWIQILTDCNAIKRRTDGLTVVNPFYFYSGTALGYEKAKALWNRL